MMRGPMMEPGSLYLPTLARARAEQLPLPPGEPVAQEKWAALFVIAGVLRRRSWKEESYQHPNSVAHLPHAEPVVPPGFTAGTYVAVEKASETRTCPDCAATPGRRKCRVCKGTNVVAMSAAGRPLQCSCSMGYVVCPACQGQGNTGHIVLRYYEDSLAGLREFLLPSHLPCYAPLFGLERAMEQAAVMELEPPEELRCHDLTGRTGGTAYRGGGRNERPTFHGHDFGDTIERALEALKAVGAGLRVIRYEIRAYAWPVLRLRYPNPKDPAVPLEVALYPDRSGKLCTFDGAQR